MIKAWAQLECKDCPFSVRAETHLDNTEEVVFFLQWWALKLPMEHPYHYPHTTVTVYHECEGPVTLWENRERYPDKIIPTRSTANVEVCY